MITKKVMLMISPRNWTRRTFWKLNRRKTMIFM